MVKAAEQLGVEDADAISRAEASAVTWARAHSAELVGKRLTEAGLVDNPNAQFAITDATRAGLERAITEAVESGASRGQLAQEISDLYGFSETRAELIAGTEINRAFMGGALETWRKSKVVVGKQWILASTHDRDDECDENAMAGKLKLNETFPDGSLMPPAHPNCKCSLLAVLKPDAK